MIRANSRMGKARTDSDGAFSFPNIAGGNYQLLARGTTYQPACFGSSRQMPGPCAAIDVEEGDVRRNVDVFARPGASIRGRVVDNAGAPIAFATIRLTTLDGARVFGLGNTGSDGRFEIGGVAAAVVTVVADVPGQRGEGGIHAYYPGVLKLADAIPISLDVGVTTEIEIGIPKIIVGSLNAQLFGPDGFRLYTFTLTQPDGRTLPLTREDDGIAHVINLREGRYVVDARAELNNKCLAAFASADVGDGTTDVGIDLVEAGVVTGRIIAERGGLPPLNQVRIGATWIQNGIAVDSNRADSTSVRADGTFSFDCLFGNRLISVSGLDAGWEVIGIRAGRSEITSYEIDVASGSRTELTITVGKR